MKNDIIHKEIDLIQACITRMAHNSFLIKGWCIALIVATLALTKENINPLIQCLIILIPLFSFWYLDAFFLRTEKMYRKMYEWVLKNRAQNNSDHLYDLNPRRFEKLVDSEKKIMFSETLRWFYGVPLLIVLIIIIIKVLPIIKKLL